MVVKEGREYRSFESTFHALDNTDGANAYMVEGYATTFDVPYDFGAGTKERILRSALDTADMSDVIFQYNHDGMVMARQRNKSLQVETDDHGLKIRAYLGGTQEGRNLYEAIANNLVDRMSWAFTIGENGWEWDQDARTATITRIDKVFDVSAVSIPADQDTEIHARSYLDGVIEREHQELVLREKEKREKQRIAAILDLI